MVYPVVRCRCCGESFVIETPMDPVQPRLGYVMDAKDIKLHNCPNVSKIKIDEDKYEEFSLLADVIGTVKKKENNNEIIEDNKESED